MQPRIRNETPIIDTSFNSAVTSAPHSVHTEPFNYAAINRRPSNEWTSMQKVILCWLASSYSNPSTDIGRIFNACFEKELPTEQGLSGNAINTMRYIMKLQADEKAAVAALQNSSSSSKSMDFVDLARSLVKRTASDINIELIENKLGSTPRPTKATNSQKKTQKKRKATVHECPMSSDDCDCTVTHQQAAELPSTPRKKSKYQRNGLLSPPTTEKRHRHLPRLYAPASSFASQDTNLTQTSLSTNGFTSPSPPSLKDSQGPIDVSPNLERRLPRLAFRSFTPESMGINTSQLFGMLVGSLDTATLRLPRPP